MSSNESFNGIMDPEKIDNFYKLSKEYFKLSLDLHAISDYNGNFVHINQAWETLLGFTMNELKDIKLIDLVHPEDKLKTINEINEAKTGKNTLTFVNRVKTKIGYYRWLSWSMISDKNDKLIFSIAHDITDHKTAENSLKVQYELITCVAKYNSIEDAAKEILKIICTHLDWEVGLLWLVDKEKKFIKVHEHWIQGENIAYKNFVEKSKQLHFQKGEALPGRLWENKETVWVSELNEIKKYFPRQLVSNEAGFKCAFAFPLLNQRKVLGVVEFYSNKIVKEDKSLIPEFNVIGNQIGGFISRKSVELQAAHLASIVESSESAIIGKNLEGKIESWNEAATRLYHYHADEIIGKSSDILYPPEKKHEIKSILTRVTSGEKIDNFETVRLGKGGNRIDVTLSISPIKNFEGKIIGISTISTDITEKKKTENELKEAYSLQKTLLDSTSYMIISTDTKGIIQIFNKAAELNLGYKKEEIIGKCTPVIVHDLNEIEERSKQLTKELGYEVPIGFDTFTAKAKKGAPDEHEWTYIRKDGSRFPVNLSVNAIFNHKKEILGYLGVIKDFSETKRFEEAIKESEKRFRSVIENAVDSFIIIDPQGIIHSFNQSSEKIFGYTADEIKGKSIEDLIDDTFIHDTIAVISLRGNNQDEKFHPISKEIVCIRKNRETFPAEISVSQMIVDNNLFYIWITRDITERKKLDTMKNEFISTVSHELRTPLTSITGSLGLILETEKSTLTRQTKKLLEIAQRNSLRLVRLINDILDLEKMEAGKMAFKIEKFNLLTLVQNVVDMNRPYADQYKVKLEIQNLSIPLYIRVDGDRFSQVLTNLVSNAIKFSPPDETVIVKIEEIHSKARVSVIDRGKGISLEFHSRIFGKFAQSDSSDKRQKGGTGLGLSISKMIIQKFGGDIKFNSELGKGTVFYFDLDIESDVPFKLNNKILICEDDPATAPILTKTVESIGCSITIVTSMAEAKDLLNKEDFKALIIDILLPNQEDIFFINEYEKKNNESFPIVVLSLKDKPEDLTSYSVIDWIKKPFNPDRLQSLLKQITKKSSQKMKKLLYVEDDLDLINIVSAIVKDFADLEFAVTLKDAKIKLEREKYDLIILDVNLPDGSGLSLINEISILKQNKVPILVFAASDVPEDPHINQSLVKSKTSNQNLIETIKNLVSPQNQI